MKQLEKEMTVPEDNDLEKDVDRFYTEAKADQLDLSAADSLSEQEMDDIVKEMMQGDPELIALVDAMENEADYNLHQVVVPEGLLASDYQGPVYGFFREETGYHVIYGWDEHMVPVEVGASLIGYIGSCPEEAQEYLEKHFAPVGQYLFGVRSGEGIVFRVASYFSKESDLPGDMSGSLAVDTRELTTEAFTFTKNLFSRNAGLIETDWMNDVCAIISGCGSVGSLVALQLARSGVGRFVLIDDECVEIHNVCRHQCGLWDVGRRKVDAVRERILRINPNAEVICFARKFQEVPWPYGKEEWLDPEKAIFIGTCDNRVGNAYVCDAAYEARIPFAALGFNTRAWGGEIFTCLPEKHQICYRCAFKKQVEQSIALERQSHDYIDAADAGRISFEPGLDVDIEYGVGLFDKVILDMINRHNPDYHPRIYHKLTQFTFFSGTDQKPDEFWKAQLREPISLKNVKFTDKLRRCPHCMLG